MNIKDIEGISTAAEATSLSIKKLKFLLDIGCCEPSFAGRHNLFISHPHPDHWGGLINYLFLRKIKDLSAPVVFVHAEYQQAFADIIKQTENLTKSELPCLIKGVNCNTREKISEDLSIDFFPVRHRKFSCLGINFKDQRENNILSYTGDSTIETFDDNKHLYNTRILITECTYFGKNATRDKAHEFHHIHLDDIYERESLWKNEIIALMHFSARYRANDVMGEIKKRAPDSLREKIYFLHPGNGRAGFININSC